MGLPARIRQVEAADLPALNRIDEAIFGELAYPYFALRQWFDVHPDELLVIDDGRLRGYSLAVRSTTPGLAWFIGLGVVPAARGCGYGRRLAVASLNQLREHGVRQVKLSVDADNSAAVGLYESLGFTVLGDRADYFGPGLARRLLELDLRPSSGANGTAGANGATGAPEARSGRRSRPAVRDRE